MFQLGLFNGRPLFWLQISEDAESKLLLAKEAVAALPWSNIPHQETHWNTASLHTWLKQEFACRFLSKPLGRDMQPLVDLPSIALLSPYPQTSEYRICKNRKDEPVEWWLSDEGRREGLSASIVLKDGKFYPSAYMLAQGAVRPIVKVRKGVFTPLMGAVLGDIAGSQFEFIGKAPRNVSPKELFTDRCVFTDDTIASLAAKSALLFDNSYADALNHLGKKYLFVGYGGGFIKWLADPNKAAANSYGDGAAMRVSYLAEYFDDVKELRREIETLTCTTHTHPEALKGAVTIAESIWIARHGGSKKDIIEYALGRYPKEDYRYGVNRPLCDYEDRYSFEVSCQDTVPVAIRCFIESESYVDFLCKICKLHGDTDTLGAMGGGIAAAFYRKTELDVLKILETYLDTELMSLMMA